MTTRPKGPGKKYTQSAQTERLGIALCNRVVTQMGHIWREKGVDFGIDGEIELVDNGQALNRVLWVQSKAQGAGNPFTGENERGFRYLCSPNDLIYWLSGTAPVILVCSHPDQDLAWFKDLRSWFSDPVQRQDRHVDFDKQADAFDESAARVLLQLGAPASTGIYLSPTPRRETLKTNLLTVDHVAPVITVAPTRCRGWADANPRLIRGGAKTISDVVFKDGNLYSFRPPDEPPISLLTNGTAELLETESLSDTAVNRPTVAQLLNVTLKDITHRDLRFHPERRFLYFMTPRDSPDRFISLRKGSKRGVVTRHNPAEGAAWIGYTRHMAVEARFEWLDGGWYLALVPTYHFTSDGREDFAFADTQLAGIKQIEGHGAVRGQTAWWAKYLAWSPTLFDNEPDRRLRFGDLVSVDVERGIDDKAWKPMPKDELEAFLPGGDSQGQLSFPGDVV